MSKYDEVLAEFSAQINEAKHKIKTNVSYLHSLLDSRESELIEFLNQTEEAYRADQAKIVHDIGSLEEMRSATCSLRTCKSNSIKLAVDKQMCHLTASLKSKTVKLEFQTHLEEIFDNLANIRIEDNSDRSPPSQKSAVKKPRSRTSLTSTTTDSSSTHLDNAISCSKVARVAAASSELLQSSRRRDFEEKLCSSLQEKTPENKQSLKSNTILPPGQRSKAFTYKRNIPFSPICYQNMEVMGYSSRKGNKFGELSNVHGVAIDPCLRRIYVCDFGNNRVQVFFESLQPAFVFGESKISRRNRMEGPWGIDIEGSRVYVTQNRGHCVSVYNLEGKLLHQMGREGSGEGELKSPRGVSVDAGHSVFVCDYGNCRVQVFYFDGKKYNYLMEIGQETCPKDVYAKHSLVYILDSMSPCLQVWTKDGTFLRKLLNTGPGQDVESAMFFTIDETGNILVSDCGHGIVAVFKPNGETVAYISSIGDELGCLNKPQGLCLLPDGGVVCVDEKAYPMLQVFN